MASKRKTRAAKKPAKRAAPKPKKRAAAKKPAKRGGAKAKRAAGKRKPAARPRRTGGGSEAVTATHRAFDAEATQQLSFAEVLGDIEESMALGKLREEE